MAPGILKLASFQEEIVVSIRIKGTLYHLGNNDFEASEVSASFCFLNNQLELKGKIRFGLGRIKRLQSISADFSEDDHSLLVNKQEAKWHFGVVKLDPFSFILKKESVEIGRGKFRLPHDVLIKQLGKIVLPRRVFSD